MSVVFQAISAVASDLAAVGVAKSTTNPDDGYDYRSIDALMNRLSPILARHKLCILPRVLERSATDRPGLNGEILVSVTLKVAFDLVSPEDGSKHSIQLYGEALDPGTRRRRRHSRQLTRAPCSRPSVCRSLALKTRMQARTGSEPRHLQSYKPQSPPSRCKAGSNGLPTSGTSLRAARQQKRSSGFTTATGALLRSLAREQPQL
jgi:hypothetical protein